MIPIPPDPQRGEDILTWARAVQATLRRLRLTSGPGIRISEGANGTAISADPPGKGGTLSIPPHPFSYIPVPHIGGGPPPPDQYRKCGVAPGFVLDMDFSVHTPSNPLSTFVVSGSGSLYVFLRIYITEDRRKARIAGITLDAQMDYPENDFDEGEELPSQLLFPIYQAHDAGGVLRIEQLVGGNLALSVTVSYVDGETIRRSFIVLGI